MIRKAWRHLSGMAGLSMLETLLAASLFALIAVSAVSWELTSWRTFNVLTDVTRTRAAAVLGLQQAASLVRQADSIVNFNPDGSSTLVLRGVDPGGDVTLRVQNGVFQAVFPGGTVDLARGVDSVAFTFPNGDASLVAIALHAHTERQPDLVFAEQAAPRDGR